MNEINLNTKKKSIFANKEILEEIVRRYYSYSDVLKYYERNLTGSNLKTLKKYIALFRISTNHFNQGLSELNQREKVIKYKFNNEEIFIENSPVEISVVKKRIIKQKIFEYKCSGCGNTGEWYGKKMTLQLEHKNGNNRDHRLENLCFLCPNCHSVTDTWGSRNIKGKKKNSVKKINKFKGKLFRLEIDKQDFLENKIKKCNTISDILNLYGYVENANNLRRVRRFLNNNLSIEVKKFIKKFEETKRKITYPDLSIMIEMVKEKGYRETGKQIGCSDNAIRKYLRKNGIDLKALK